MTPNTAADRLTQMEFVGPAQQVTTRFEHPHRLAVALIDILAGHRRQQETTFLSSALVAEFQLIHHVAKLWIEEHEGRTSIRQRMQELERGIALHGVGLKGGSALEHGKLIGW